MVRRRVTLEADFRRSPHVPASAHQPYPADLGGESVPFMERFEIGPAVELEVPDLHEVGMLQHQPDQATVQ